MFKKILMLLLFAYIGFMTAGCNDSVSVIERNEENSKIIITASIHPIKEFAEKIAGERAQVICMVPDNVEPHDYEPKTRDFKQLMKSDIFIYNGLGMEPWVDKVNNMIEEKDILIVDSSKDINVRMEDSIVDPHSWLSLKQAEKQAENIKDALVLLDQDNKMYYEENYNYFKLELDSLYDEFKSKFNTLSNKDFITGHSAFGYLCRDFGLHQKSVENLFGDGEPTPRQLEDLVIFCRENDVKVIFSESSGSQRVSETLASEVKASVVPILTLESNEDDKSYLEAVRYDLEEIYKSLKIE
ncbi:MAG: zinc ABC transporter substrate-binding protein [Clostridium sp.]|nr:zinc ABC transporter substrate-binding protein [Clostridium sp.]